MTCQGLFPKSGTNVPLILFVFRGWFCTEIILWFTRNWGNNISNIFTYQCIYVNILQNEFSTAMSYSTCTARANNLEVVVWPIMCYFLRRRWVITIATFFCRGIGFDFYLNMNCIFSLFVGFARWSCRLALLVWPRLFESLSVSRWSVVRIYGSIGNR